MDHYKHSCPHCGQRIEYTREYCGKNLSCPSCGKLVMFPAIPPGGFKKTLRLAKAGPAAREKIRFQLGPMLKKALVLAREFEHWRVVGFCLIPFVVIGVGLIAATALRQQQEAAPADARGPAHGQVDAGTWEKMENLARADQLMQDHVQTVRVAKARLDAAKRSSENLRTIYRGQALTESMMSSYRAADQEISNAQQSYTTTRQHFLQAYAAYQNMGGKVDYPSQVPP